MHPTGQAAQAIPQGLEEGKIPNIQALNNGPPPSMSRQSSSQLDPQAVSAKAVRSASDVFTPYNSNFYQRPHQFSPYDPNSGGVSPFFLNSLNGMVDGSFKGPGFQENQGSRMNSSAAKCSGSSILENGGLSGISQAFPASPGSAEFPLGVAGGNGSSEVPSRGNGSAAFYSSIHYPTFSGSSEASIRGLQDSQDIRRLKQVNQQLKEKNRLAKQELITQQRKYADVALRAQNMAQSYNHDIVLLLQVIDGLLNELVSKEYGKTTKVTDANPSRTARDHDESKKTDERCSIKGSKTDEKISLLQRFSALQSVVQKNLNSLNKSTEKSDEEKCRSKVPPFTENPTLRELATCLQLEFEDFTCGTVLQEVTTEVGREKTFHGHTHSSVSCDKKSEMPLVPEEQQATLEEDLRAIALEAHKNLESYLQSLNYGFSSGTGNRGPLAIQIPVPVVHPFIAGSGE